MVLEIEDKVGGGRDEADERGNNIETNKSRANTGTIWKFNTLKSSKMHTSRKMIK